MDELHKSIWWLCKVSWSKRGERESSSSPNQQPSQHLEVTTIYGEFGDGVGRTTRSPHSTWNLDVGWKRKSFFPRHKRSYTTSVKWSESSYAANQLCKDVVQLRPPPAAAATPTPNIGAAVARRKRKRKNYLTCRPGGRVVSGERWSCRWRID